MPPGSKLTKHTSPMATEDLQLSEWERSRISNQDVNLLKKLGFMKQEKTLIFPGEESYPTPHNGYPVTFVDHLIRGLATPVHKFLRGLLFVYGLQLHHPTPNSILHISIFITLCECFLGTPPNWCLWKRIFLVRRNSSHTTAYNIGGVVICVRPDVEYFDVKFPDSVQGWRKRWLYIHEEHNDVQEYNVAPFDGGEKICRRHSMDAEASDEEKKATDALMKRIHELQNTRGKELSGIQITAYFLRIRVQPLQARRNPLWMYAGAKDVDRFSKDLSIKDLEKLVRKISSLSKKDDIPSSCRVEPYSGANALPKGTSRPESEVAGSHKSAASSEKEIESEASESTHSLPSAASPMNKRKRDEVADSGTSKAGKSHAEEAVPEEEGTIFNPYDDALVTSGDEEEDPPVNVTALMSTSRTLVISESRPITDETSPPQQVIGHPTPVGSPHAPSPKKARIELGKESSLLTGSSATPPMDDDFDLENLEDDHLLDALSLLEIHGEKVRQSIAGAKSAFSRLFPYFFAKKEQPDTFAALAKHFIPEENLGLGLRQEGLKIGVEGTLALVAESQQNVDRTKFGDVKKMETKRWQSLIKATKPNSKKILSFLGCKPTPSPSSTKLEVK
ncbi:hypothetical protein QYE76_037467 [Lolium multiflorum]|uniref:Transposase (putative) gypsy type domain-containing protein n=1 Tax=Lolium multiflorum TaxID=4521 RepID=A0AAD8QHX5_LOLMU|nr:hypothetical protein QYE76_037467 [Lolium multiflorum]